MVLLRRQQLLLLLLWLLRLLLSLNRLLTEEGGPHLPQSLLEGQWRGGQILQRPQSSLTIQQWRRRPPIL